MYIFSEKGGLKLELSVAIDGPAGAGKSTIAKILGRNYGLMYINTGAMYRAITFAALKNNISFEQIEELCKMTDTLEMHFDGDKVIVNNEDISDQITLPAISQNVSNYASVPEIRERLVYLQQRIAKKYSVVMDGRDIGTVVLKDAAFKFFLTASAEKRALRRYKELINKGIDVQYDKILNEIIERDYIDSHRKVNPLRKASDAIEIDSSDMTVDDVVKVMSEYIDKSKNKL